jgi:hypothetical protein
MGFLRNKLLFKDLGFSRRVKSTIFWDITPCSPLRVNRHFGGIYRLHFQGRKIIWARHQHESRWQAELWRWRWYVPPKRGLTLNELHGIMSQKTELFITTAENLKSYMTKVECQPTFWEEHMAGGTCFYSDFLFRDLSTLKMEAICSSEKSVGSQRTTRRYIPENGTLQLSFKFSKHFQRCK